MPVTVRVAADDDCDALADLDLTYPTGRYLAINRAGESPELSISLEWRKREAPERNYNEYTADGLRSALSRVDLFLAGLIEGRPVGMLIIMKPEWTDAAEITDLAVDRSARRSGIGRALVERAADWARERGYRSLWVEPRADNAGAIDFYTRLGFRLSVFNRMYSNSDDAPGKTTLFMHMDLT
jgi:ribosomal protein S18 acetylase RimI-like enzyme